MLLRRPILFASPIHAGLALIALLAIFTQACAHRASRASHPAATKPSARRASSQKHSSLEPSTEVETGIASWYGDPYHGRRAASGEIFDKRKLTAAHRTLPFETMVEVTNLASGRKVEVRINDRGPFVDGRIIDLSEAAAREIDLIRSGVTQVSLRVMQGPADGSGETARQTSRPPAVGAMLAKPVSPSSGAGLRSFYAVQVGSYIERSQAETAAAEISRKIGESRVMPVGGDTLRWVVLVGRRMTVEQAGALAGQIAGAVGATQVVIDPFTE